MSFLPKFLRRFALPAIVLSLCNIGSAAADTPTPAATSDDELVQISESNILFFYEAHADFRSTPESLAAAFSAEYRNAANEFAKQSLLQTVQPVIERKVKEASAARQVMLRMRWTIPEYDFKRQGFQTGLSSSSFATFSAGATQYAVAYKGVKPFAFLEVPQAQAAALGNELSRSREGYLEVVGEIVSAEEQLLNASSYKTVYLKPSTATFYLKSGTKVGTIPAGKP